MYERGEHQRVLLALSLGPDDAIMRGLDCYPPPVDPEYETLMTSLAKRQYGEAEAFKRALDEAIQRGALDAPEIARFREDYRALGVRFRTEANRYSEEYHESKRLAQAWQGLEQGLRNEDRRTR